MAHVIQRCLNVGEDAALRRARGADFERVARRRRRPDDGPAATTPACSCEYGRVERLRDGLAEHRP
jgi:hypothetical protein